MKNYQKIQAIQGLITDFKERYYFQKTTGASIQWTEQDHSDAQDELLDAIREVVKE